MDTKTERIFRLINVLKHRRTEEELSQLFQMSSRNIKRDLNELRKHGFVLKKDHQKMYWIPEADVDKVPKFTIEECKILRELVMGYDAEKPIKEMLLEKLYYSSDQYILTGKVNNIALSDTISKITKAIDEKKQVILKSYYSINSDSERDRLVEPLVFSLRNSQVKAFEPESGIQKSFNLTRIKDVEILEEVQTNDIKDIDQEDIFGMSSPEPIKMKLELNKKAHAILLSEYPHAVHFIEQESVARFILETDVRRLEGVGRFVLGLLNDVKIMKPESLKDWIKAQIKTSKY